MKVVIAEKSVISELNKLNIYVRLRKFTRWGMNACDNEEKMLYFYSLREYQSENQEKIITCLV